MTCCSAQALPTSCSRCFCSLASGAMIDFGPLLSNPKLLLFGAAAQFGHFCNHDAGVRGQYDFPGACSALQDAACVGIIGAADGPTAIFVSNYFDTKYLGAIVVAAYSYMALVPIIQPPVIRAITTKRERMIRMPYEAKEISRTVRILFPHCGNSNCRPCGPAQRGIGGLFDVRQPAA